MMTQAKLTAKQEAFAQGIADGLGQADAYRMAYDADGMKDESIYPQASKLMKNPKVATRIGELKAQVADKQLWTREMSVKGLMSAYRIALEAKSSTGMTGAVKELNIMHGYNEPTKLSVDMKFKPITDEDWL
ncbi:MAG: terminase small subunit [Shewanella sp.]